jgi:hypothetical protein
MRERKHYRHSNEIPNDNNSRRDQDYARRSRSESPTNQDHTTFAQRQKHYQPFSHMRTDTPLHTPENVSITKETINTQKLFDAKAKNSNISFTNLLEYITEISDSNIQMREVGSPGILTEQEENWQNHYTPESIARIIETIESNEVESNQGDIKIESRKLELHKREKDENELQKLIENTKSTLSDYQNNKIEVTEKKQAVEQMLDELSKKLQSSKNVLDNAPSNEVTDEKIKKYMRDKHYKEDKEVESKREIEQLNKEIDNIERLIEEKNNFLIELEDKLYDAEDNVKAAKKHIEISEQTMGITTICSQIGGNIANMESCYNALPLSSEDSPRIHQAITDNHTIKSSEALGKRQKEAILSDSVDLVQAQNSQVDLTHALEVNLPMSFHNHTPILGSSIGGRGILETLHTIQEKVNKIDTLCKKNYSYLDKQYSYFVDQLEYKDILYKKWEDTYEMQQTKESQKLTKEKYKLENQLEDIKRLDSIERLKKERETLISADKKPFDEKISKARVKKAEMAARVRALTPEISEITPQMFDNIPQAFREQFVAARINEAMRRTFNNMSQEFRNEFVANETTLSEQYQMHRNVEKRVLEIDKKIKETENPNQPQIDSMTEELKNKSKELKNIPGKYTERLKDEEIKINSDIRDLRDNYLNRLGNKSVWEDDSNSVEFPDSSTPQETHSHYLTYLNEQGDPHKELIQLNQATEQIWQAGIHFFSFARCWKQYQSRIEGNNKVKDYLLQPNNPVAIALDHLAVLAPYLSPEIHKKITQQVKSFTEDVISSIENQTPIPDLTLQELKAFNDTSALCIKSKIASNESDSSVEKIVVAESSDEETDAPSEKTLRRELTRGDKPWRESPQTRWQAIQHKFQTFRRRTSLIDSVNQQIDIIVSTKQSDDRIAAWSKVTDLLSGEKSTLGAHVLYDQIMQILDGSEPSDG